VPEKKIVAEIESRREVKAASGELRLARCAAPRSPARAAPRGARKATVTLAPRAAPPLHDAA
jgi:hypothetical protein